MPTTVSMEAPVLSLAEVVWRDAERMSGTPCFTGTRVPVQTLFDYLAGGDSLDDFFEAFPGVSRAQALSALYHGQARLLEESQEAPSP